MVWNQNLESWRRIFVLSKIIVPVFGCLSVPIWFIRPVLNPKCDCVSNWRADIGPRWSPVTLSAAEPITLVSICIWKIKAVYYGQFNNPQNNLKNKIPPNNPTEIPQHNSNDYLPRDSVITLIELDWLFWRLFLRWAYTSDFTNTKSCHLFS